MKKLLVIAVLFISFSFSTTAEAQDAMLGEVRLFAGNFAPRGWALCEGQLLKISEHSALFSLLGCMYGGDCRTTFALPDLRDKVPFGPTKRSVGASTKPMSVKSDSNSSDAVEVKGTLKMNYIIALQGYFKSRS